ncbi:MAG: hypothetical protein A3E80_06770 [Chlamydiae bacterium RIFCSPHIGHO2_12_FULL_49_9]|nr:MAG: hypothetical protein A3E80_06770 [Chlamydiae bacterium RIFCSPHIGHO2_12_FULL_49_9]
MLKKRNKKALLDALAPFGDVLQAGFGNGDLAEEMQKFQLRSHTIIEPDPSLAKKARKWAAKQPAVKVIEEPWEIALRGLGVFDSIAFEGFASQTLVDGEERFQEVHEKIPGLLKVRYSDSDLDAFCKAVDPQMKGKLSVFLAELEQNGQVDAKQRKGMVRKHKLKEVKIERFSFPTIFFFLKRCLASHMRKNSRFAARVQEALPKAAERALFDEVIVNPLIGYREVDLVQGKLFVVEKLG